MLGCAVVGLGIGLAHCAGYLGSPHARLVAVCDLQPERLAAVGGTFRQGSMTVLQELFPAEDLALRWEEKGVKTFTSIDKLLRDPRVDIVSLCTPDHTHAGLAVKVLRAGKHLLLEKPLALGLAEAERIREALERAGTCFAVGYEFRLNPVVQLAGQLARSGRLGEIEAFALHHFRTPFKRDKWNRWIQKKAFSGGLLVEETCHWFDLARFLTGKEVSSLHCVKTDRIHPDFDFEDIAYVNGAFRGGGILQIAHSLAGFDFNLTFILHGAQGTAWCSLKEERLSSLDGRETGYHGIVAFGRTNGGPAEAEVVRFGREATEPENIRDYARRFAECVALRQTPPAGFADGWESLRLALLAGQAGDRGVVVPC